MEITQDAVYYFDIFKLASDIFSWVTRGDVSGTGRSLENAGFTLLSWYILIAGTLSVLLILLIIILFRRVLKLYSKIKSPAIPIIVGEELPVPASTARWEHVLELLSSQNPGDWRLAVLEADIILDEIVTKMGYQGQNLGDKLKNIEKSDFLSLDDAWEAHKIRNIIAHRGSDYVLTLREARRVIELFARVFQEFGYI
jgi:hypothetical protein